MTDLPRWFVLAAKLLAFSRVGEENASDFPTKEECPMNRLSLLLTVSVLFVLGRMVPGERPASPKPDAIANTFSVVTFDPDRKEWGVAVASKCLAVGAVVPWAKAGVGAVATQSAVNITLGTRGLELIAQGKSAEETIKALTDAGRGKDYRQ